MKWKMPLFKIYSDDTQNVKDITSRSFHWATGLEIQLFENKISQYIGRKYTVLSNSGTSTLHDLLLAHNIKTNNELMVAQNSEEFLEVEP